MDSKLFASTKFVRLSLFLRRKEKREVVLWCGDRFPHARGVSIVVVACRRVFQAMMIGCNTYLQTVFKYVRQRNAEIRTHHEAHMQRHKSLWHCKSTQHNSGIDSEESTRHFCHCNRNNCFIRSEASYDLQISRSIQVSY